MSRSVVLVDHHQALLEGLALLLGTRGWTVAGASGSWRAGLELIDRHAPDVALVGIRLTDGDGITLTRQALRAAPERRVLLYTDASDDDDEVRAGLESGARGFVLRAGSTDELVRALDAVASGGSYRDPRLAAAAGSGRRPAARPAVLSKRETQVLQLLASGMSGERVAEHLVLSAETVRTHVRNAMAKLGASTRVHAVAIAMRAGYIDGPEPSSTGTP